MFFEFSLDLDANEVEEVFTQILLLFSFVLLLELGHVNLNKRFVFDLYLLWLPFKLFILLLLLIFLLFLTIESLTCGLIG